MKINRETSPGAIAPASISPASQTLVRGLDVLEQAAQAPARLDANARERSKPHWLAAEAAESIVATSQLVGEELGWRVATGHGALSATGEDLSAIEGDGSRQDGAGLGTEQDLLQELFSQLLPGLLADRSAHSAELAAGWAAGGLDALKTGGGNRGGTARRPAWGRDEGDRDRMKGRPA